MIFVTIGVTEEPMMVTTNVGSSFDFSSVKAIPSSDDVNVLASTVVPLKRATATIDGIDGCELEHPGEAADQTKQTVSHNW